MDGRRLILKDGTTIENGEAGYSDSFLWLWFPNMTLAQASAIAFDPAKTDRIEFQYGEMTDVYNGFTDCRSMSIDTDGVVSVCMAKGE